VLILVPHLFLLYILYEVRFIRQEKSGGSPVKAFCSVVLLSLAILTGCSSGNGLADELLETARFEEKQGNTEHATKLYEEILKKYPSSAASREAGTRMEVLKQRKP
jgi:outer membrane protein assembly factor BamD (BamD/ComL family)